MRPGAVHAGAWWCMNSWPSAACAAVHDWEKTQVGRARDGYGRGTISLASTRSSQLSYTRKSEEALVLPRLCGVKLGSAKVVRSTPLCPRSVHTPGIVRRGAPPCVDEAAGCRERRPLGALRGDAVTNMNGWGAVPRDRAGDHVRDVRHARLVTALRRVSW